MHLFVTQQFLKDLFWFTSHWADTSKETAGQYTYTEVRDARSGAFLYNKDHTPTGAITTFLNARLRSARPRRSCTLAADQSGDCVVWIS